MLLIDTIGTGVILFESMRLQQDLLKKKNTLKNTLSVAVND